MNSTKEMALHLHSQGIVPVAARGKIPIEKGWQKRQWSPEQIERTFTADVNVAVLCGPNSGNNEVIDFDCRGEAYSEYVKRVEQKAPGLINKLLVEQSPSGGYHLHYRTKDIKIPGNTKLADKRVVVDGQGEHPYKNKDKKYTAIKDGTDWVITPDLIETRGEGGQAVIYPSPGYQLIQPGPDGTFNPPGISAKERDILISTAKEFHEPLIKDTFTPIISPNGDLRPGDDYNNRTTGQGVLALLESKGWKMHSRNGDKTHVTRPGKEIKDGPSATVYDTGVLHVFSDNTGDFEAWKSYAPFAVYTFFKFGTDDSNFTAAARELGRQGYGNAPKQYEQILTVNEGKKALENIDFPKEVISGVAGQAVELFGEYIESPPQFVYMTFITLLGAMVSRMVSLQSAIKVQTRLYTVLIGPSGQSRKSTVISLLIDFIKSLLTREFNLGICWGVGSDIGLLRQMKKSDSLILALDEFKALTSKSNIKASALLPAISTFFDRNEYSNFTKLAKDSFEINDGHLSMIAASTPETFEEVWSSEFTNIGLNNRLFLVTGVGKKGGLPKEIPTPEYKWLKSEVGKILGVVGGGLQLSLTEDAENLWNDWYMNLENSIHSQRLESYSLRLACIMAVNEFKGQIDADIVNKATQLCNWQLIVRKLNDPVNADNATATLEGKIRRQLEVRGPMTKRELVQYTNARRAGLYYFDNAIKNLTNIQDVVFKDETNKYYLPV